MSESTGVVLVIGDLDPSKFFDSKLLKMLTEVRITEVEAQRGGRFSVNKAGEELRALLGHEPTDVIYVIMLEEVWLDFDTIVNEQRDYFTACKEMWVLREDGTKELVRSSGE